MAGQKVFVVDDDAATRSALDSVLRSVGYEVELFESAAEFMPRALQHPPGCIVLDVRLPGPSGLEIQRRLADAKVRLPIIFITGHGDISMAVEAMKAHAVEFLTKPFRDQDLLDAIGVAMECDAAARQENSIYLKLLSRLELLSPREREVFERIGRGQVGKQIAYELNLSMGTIKVHRRNLMRKLEINSIGQAIQMYAELTRGGSAAA